MLGAKMNKLLLTVSAEAIWTREYYFRQKRKGIIEKQLNITFG